MSIQQANVTIKDIARYCGVSVSTVSCALRGDRANVSEAVIQKIMQAADELGYDATRFHSARRLRLSQSDQFVLNHAILVCFPLSYTIDPFFSRILVGMAEELERERFALMLYSPNGENTDHLRSLQFPVPLTRGDIDGAVLMSGTAHLPDMIARLRSEPQFGERPILSLLDPNPGCISVLVDYRAGSYAGMAHLLALGHRRVGYFQTGDYILEQRLDGMRQACGDFCPQENVEFIKIPWETGESFQENNWVKIISESGCTAILACNDLAACNLAAYLQRAEYSIPDDISIIGFDDTHSLPDAQGHNMLTTVHSPLEEVGRRGAQLLLQRITQQIAYDPVEIVPTNLILRGSTAPPAI
ncbi:MAG: LacI family DNA-binding transcriptional regulator [bacterium]